MLPGLLEDVLGTARFIMEGGRQRSGWGAAKGRAGKEEQPCPPRAHARQRPSGMRLQPPTPCTRPSPSGQGGYNLGQRKQIADQSMEQRGNAAMRESMRRKQAVRVWAKVQSGMLAPLGCVRLVCTAALALGCCALGTEAPAAGADAPPCLRLLGAWGQ